MCSCFFFVIFVSFRIGLILGFPLSIGTIDLSLFAGEGGEGGMEGGKGGGREGGEETFRSVSCQMVTLSLNL